MLRIKNFVKTIYGKTIIDDISLTVERGEIAVLLGASGVGKSTLLRLLNNLERLDSGVVTLDGNMLDLHTVNQTHTIGMVFQQFNLFEHMTVAENISFALEKTQNKTKKETQPIVNELLKRYGLHDKAGKYPAQLSGGQKQRVAIARTLALKPTVICLDEPTSALDPLLTNQVAQTISQLAKEGYIILIATHDTALLDKLDCTIHLMSAGKIIESANSKEFNANKNKYTQIKQFVAGNIE